MKIQDKISKKFTRHRRLITKTFNELMEARREARIRAIEEIYKED